MSNRFDFSKIDEALPGAEKMQREERLANTLEDNYKAVHALCDMVEKLENRLLEALSDMDGAVSSLRQASKVTVSEETGRVLEREGDKICRKIAGRLEDESARLFDRLSAKDRVVISSMSFWCMIEVIVFLLAALSGTCAANVQFIHSALLWQIFGYATGFLAVCIALTVLVCHKLKR